MINNVSQATSYAKQLNLLSVSARTQLQQRINSLAELYNDVPTGRTLFYQNISNDFQVIQQLYGEASQALALQMLEEQGIPVRALPSTGTYIQGIIQKAIEQEKFPSAYLDEAMDLAVKRGYRDTIQANAERFARVPVGAYTCNWCVMLASRGFVYSNIKNHKEYHAYCDCLWVPSKKAYTIKGYDPDALLELYHKNAPIGERDRSESTVVEQENNALS